MGKRGPKRVRPLRPSKVRCENPGKWCECGNEKHWYSHACSRCYELDGNLLSADIIAEMRIDRTATINQLARLTGARRDAVHHAVLRLARSGRLRKYDPLGSVGTEAEWRFVR